MIRHFDAVIERNAAQGPALARFMRKDQDLRALLDNPQFQELMNAAARLQ